MKSKTYTREDLLDELNRVADELGHSPSVKEMNNHPDSPSATPYITHFNSWNDAKRAAGLKPLNEVQYDREELIELLWEAHDEIGRSPTGPEFNELDSVPNTNYYKREFGSWNKAKEAVGMEKVSGGPERNPDSKIGIYRNALEDGSCQICGFNINAALCFHHPENVEKVENVSLMPDNGYSVAEIRQEIDKCILVCSNCHSRLHAEDDSFEPNL